LRTSYVCMVTMAQKPVDGRQESVWSFECSASANTLSQTKSISNKCSAFSKERARRENRPDRSLVQNVAVGLWLVRENHSDVSFIARM